MAGSNYTWEQRGEFCDRHFGAGYARGIDKLLMATESIAGTGNVDSAKPRSPSSRTRKSSTRKSSRSASGATA